MTSAPVPPPWLRPFRTVIAAVVVMTILGALLLFAVEGEDGALAGGPGQPKIIVVQTEPPNLVLKHNEVIYRTPATLIVVQGESTQVQVTHQGATSTYEIDVPLGAETMQYKISLVP
ncbi:MAG: hypothetical protein ACO3JL_20690 [Myxococcota bacterium]